MALLSGYGFSRETENFNLNALVNQWKKLVPLHFCCFPAVHWYLLELYKCQWISMHLAIYIWVTLVNELKRKSFYLKLYESIFLPILIKNYSLLFFLIGVLGILISICLYILYMGVEVLLNWSYETVVKIRSFE